MALNRQKRLKILRILAGFSAKELAAALQVSPPTVSYWESAGVKTLTPNYLMLRNLADVLGVPQEYLSENPTNDHGIENCIWRLTAAKTEQYRRAICSDIMSLLPELLQENDINFGYSAHLSDGVCYLLFRNGCANASERINSSPSKHDSVSKKNPDFCCILLIGSSFANTFEHVFLSQKKIYISPKDNLKDCSIDSINLNAIKTLVSDCQNERINFAKFVEPFHKLHSLPRQDSLLISKSRLQTLIVDLIEAVNGLPQKRLSVESVSEISDLFVKILENRHDTGSDLRSAIYKVSVKNG